MDIIVNFALLSNDVFVIFIMCGSFVVPVWYIFVSERIVKETIIQMVVDLIIILMQKYKCVVEIEWYKLIDDDIIWIRDG